MYMLIYCCIYSTVQSSLLWHLSWPCHRFKDPNLDTLVAMENQHPHLYGTLCGGVRVMWSKKSHKFKHTI